MDFVVHNGRGRPGSNASDLASCDIYIHGMCVSVMEESARHLLTPSMASFTRSDSITPLSYRLFISSAFVAPVLRHSMVLGEDVARRRERRERAFEMVRMATSRSNKLVSK